MNIITENKFRWIDIEKPNKDDLQFLKTNFKIKDSVLSRLITPMKRTEIEDYTDYLFVILHFPNFDSRSAANEPEELDVIITKDTLITCHNGGISEHLKFCRIIRDNPTERKKYLGKGHTHLLYHLLDCLIDTRLPMLDHIAENIKKIEEQAFKGPNRQVLEQIAFIKRDIISFRSIIQPQRAVIESLIRKIDRLFGGKMFEVDTQEVIGSNIKVWNILEHHKEMIEAIEATSNELLSYKLNETMKILTVVSVILMPMALIANLWGMNLEKMPFAENPTGFWLIIALLVLTGVVLTIYFKIKKWL